MRAENKHQDIVKAKWYKGMEISRIPEMHGVG